MQNRTRPRDLFSREEIQALTARSDLAGWWAVLSTWAVIAATFAMMALWPSMWTVGLGLILLGGRQLALAILMHDAAHGTLFRRRFLNDKVTDWLCARIVWNDLPRYRAHHLKHHANTNRENDPDWSLSAPFPVSRMSLARKFLRDLLGLTGLKRLVGQFLIDIGHYGYTVANDARPRARDGEGAWDYAREGVRNMSGVLVANLLLVLILAACGQAWLYLVWVAAYLTTFSLFVRIRSMAEHAVTEQGADPLRNTRTTRAGWLARATVAPIRVNCHIEHHLMASVPYFRLPRLHQLLKARADLVEPPGYLQVLHIVSRPG